MSTTKHAVLFSREGIMPYSTLFMPYSTLLWIDGKEMKAHTFPEPCYTLYELANMAYKHFVTHLWVMPAYGDFIAIKGLGDWSFSCYENRKGQMMGAAARKRGHRQIDVNIIFPQHTSWYGTEKAPGWLRDVEPHDLLITIHYLEQALGITITGSPGRTGWNYLKKLHPEWVEDVPGCDLKACHFDRKAAADIIWQRPLLSIERKKLYLHKYDKNAAYPYAATQTDIGVGTPVHVDHGGDSLPVNNNQAVGVWRCDVKKNNDTWMSSGRPDDWREGESWLMGPVIRLLRHAGYSVKAQEGYVFPEKHDVLVKWGKDLWAIRQGFSGPKWINKKCAGLAAKATKEMANKTVGMTAFGDFDEDEEMARPDIRLQVIARHRELTWHNIDKIRAMYGVTPCIVYMDALYYASVENDGRKALPELMKREGQFGGYKWEGCIPMEKALPILDAKMSEASKLEELNKIGWSV